MVYVTTQTASVDANAGLTQNIAVTSPAASASLFGGAGSTTPSTLQNGPGWATAGGGPSVGTTTATNNWGLYAVILALAYWAFKQMGN